MTQSIYQALDDSRRLPWPEAMGKATIRARFMLAYADADADTLPDAHAPRGTVTLVYAGSGYRWTDADGSRLVAALPVVCPILPDGTLGSPDYNLEGDGGVIIMPTEVAGLEPVGSTVTATIRIANAQATFAPITFTVKPDDDINLAELVSVQATPGVVTVVDDTIAVRAEAAANRAEDASSDASGALTQITAATETVQSLSDTITAAVDEVTSLEASAAGSASIAETAATEAGTARDETQTLLATAQNEFITEADLAGAPRLTNLVHDITWIAGNSTIDSQTPRLTKFTVATTGGLIRARDLMPAGAIYYLAADVKTTSNRVFFGTGWSPAYHSGSGDWERLTSLASPPSGTYFNVRDNRSSGWDQIEVRDPVLINLTAVFGAGREPSKEYMDALMAKHGNYIGGVDQFAVGDALRELTVAGQGMGIRIDNSVGTRVFLDHPGGSTMLYGDTGWRSIPVPTGIAGATPAGETPLRIRRVGDIVHVIIDRITFTGDYVSGSLSILVGAGFGPSSMYLPNAGYPNTNVRAWVLTGATLSAYAGTAVTDGRWQWAFTTSQPWPTTLPGTPA